MASQNGNLSRSKSEVVHPRLLRFELNEAAHKEIAALEKKFAELRKYASFAKVPEYTPEVIEKLRDDVYRQIEEALLKRQGTMKDTKSGLTE